MYRCVYKHPDMNAKFCNDEYLTPLLLKINKEDKLCLLMGDFNINLVNSDTKPEVSEFFDSFSSHFFTGYYYVTWEYQNSLGPKIPYTKLLKFTCLYHLFIAFQQ